MESRFGLRAPGWRAAKTDQTKVLESDVFFTLITACFLASHCGVKTKLKACRGRYWKMHRIILVMRSRMKPLPRAFKWSACAERSEATRCRFSCCFGSTSCTRVGISRHTLLIFHHVACEDGVNSKVYANARIRRDKGVERLRTAYGLYEHLSTKKQYTINPKYSNTIHISLTK